MLTVAAPASGHHGSAATTVALAFVVVGLGLIVNGVTSQVARRARGREATLGLGYRTQERLAPASIKIGLALLVLGLLGGAVLWILS